MAPKLLAEAIHLQAIEPMVVRRLGGRPLSRPSRPYTTSRPSVCQTSYRPIWSARGAGHIRQRRAVLDEAQKPSRLDQNKVG
jgi:hypothetical protein